MAKIRATSTSPPKNPKIKKNSARISANNRERERMRKMAEEFVNLRKCLEHEDWVPRGTKLSKLNTLVLTIYRIQYLECILDNDFIRARLILSDLNEHFQWQMFNDSNLKTFNFSQLVTVGKRRDKHYVIKKEIKQEEDESPGSGIHYKGMPAEDFPKYDLTKHFEESFTFIDSALATNGKVLVHCMQGMSRSPTIVAAYIMERKGMSATNAIKKISQNRDIYPNVGFLHQLAHYEEMLTTKRPNTVV